jgi:hypothetical protein
VINSTRMKWARHVKRIEERCVQGFDGVTWRINVTWEELGVYGKIILKWIFKNWEGEAWSVLLWLRIGRGGGHLWMR